MTDTLKFVQEHLDASAPIDVSETFGAWTNLVDRLRQRVAARFELRRDPSTDVLEGYGSAPGPAGRLAAYAGPEVDWMVHSWMENAEAGFCNVHLTVWLGPQVRVPHFGLALGCFPQAWLYLDSVPRSHLTVDTDAFDRYYAPVNDRWEQVQREHTYTDQFVSRSAFVRAGLSPTAICFTAPRSGPTVTLVEELAEEHLDRWLGWVDAAEPVPAEEQAALAATDLAIRRNIAERDPANVMGERYFGSQTTQHLVRALWGADRELPRPHERRTA